MDKRRLAAWLYEPQVLGGTLDSAWKLGVRVLVNAAQAGLALRRKAPVRWPDGRAGTATFDERLAQMLTRLRVTKASAAAPAQEVSRTLISELREQAQLTIRLDEHLRPASFHAPLERARRLWRDSVRLPLNTETPFDLLRSAYLVLRAAFNRVGRPTDTHLMALAMVGIAWRGIRRTRPCKVCFRWALPGQTFCLEHSRSKAGRGTPRERARRQKQAQRLGSWTGVVKRPKGIPPARMPFVVARLLWNLRAGTEAAMLRAAVRVIDESVHLRSIPGLPKKATVHSATLQALRDALDPFEFDAPAWVDKLLAAHLWFDAQNNATHQRGGGRAMRSRLLEACQLAEGGFNRGEIAQALDLAPSAVSNWLNRYADPDHELHELRERLARALERDSSPKRRGAARREIRRRSRLVGRG